MVAKIYLYPYNYKKTAPLFGARRLHESPPKRQARQRYGLVAMGKEEGLGKTIVKQRR
jgi:hypothetical protein